MDFKQEVNETKYTILSFFSGALQNEIKAFFSMKKTGMAGLNEIRLRAYGTSSVVVEGRNVPLSSRPTPEELHTIFKRACDMAVFAHRDDICRGFVSVAGGVRVGICGFAKYDGGSIVGVSDISTLVFRIPSSHSSVVDKLYREWVGAGCGGMLVCSRAGEGKTTAIRALAKRIGSPPEYKRVVVVDERCEFDPYFYKSCSVDILRGYKRALGVDIAIRTLSAEVIIVDEIGGAEDSLAMLSAIGAGIPIIATAHGRSIEEVRSRSYINDLIERGLFDTYATISRDGETFELKTGTFYELA